MFDSWENLRPRADDEVIVSMLQEFAKQISEGENPKVSRVMIGTRGKTPAAFKPKPGSPPVYADTMKEGYQYGDSEDQHVVHESKRLIEARTEIQEKFPGEHIETSAILSPGLAARILDFINTNNNIDLIRTIGKTVGSLSSIMTAICQYPGEDLETFVEVLATSNYDATKIGALISADAIAAYNAGVKFVGLKDLYENERIKFEALTSEGAIDAYRTGVKFADLAGLYNEDKSEDKKKFKFLISDETIAEYEKGKTLQEMSARYDEEHAPSQRRPSWQEAPRPSSREDEEPKP